MGKSRIGSRNPYNSLRCRRPLSPLEAAATAIDIHNEASKWNKALLDNSARPSGALVYGNGATMTAAQFERLKSELEETYTGARNAGRPMLLEGGLDWKAMSLSPRDMDFIALKNGAAREIALALGVPPMLVGIPGDNTYANYAEANRVFWRQTVIPLVQRSVQALSAWLTPAYGHRLTLRPDLDHLDALSLDRDAQWSRLQSTTFLTDDEKRAAVGYGPKPVTVARKYSPDQPRDETGRWTDGGGFGGKIPKDVVNPASPPEKPAQEAAKKPRIGPPKAPPKGTPAEPKKPQADFGKTDGGRPHTEHSKKEADNRGFTDKNIDDIVSNNAKNRTGKVDKETGRKTWEYTDSRGNRMVTNEDGGIVSVHRLGPYGTTAGKYIPKP
jgi:hypothetical protein